MKVGIIGAGFTGLAAGYYLSKRGCRVEIFERDMRPGGLAIGYQELGWKWTLEEHYHHWFTNDKNVLALTKEVGHKVEIKKPKTSSFVDGKIYQLDSPASLLNFPMLSMIDRIRMGASLALLRFNPIWKPFEKFHAEPYLKTTMGQDAYKILWEPLMKNKLGKYAKAVSLAWFWARIYKRTSSLAYPEGGFLNFARHLQKIIEQKGGKFYYDAEVIKLSSEGKPKLKIVNRKSSIENRQYDAVIVTLPSFLFQKIAPDLPVAYKDKLGKLRGIGAVNLILRLKREFLTDGTYWLNMCVPDSPILAIVEHTNFISSKYYNNEHIVYLGNYMEQTDPQFSMTTKQLLKLYDPWLKKLNSTYHLSLITSHLFKIPFAQPIITPNYSKNIPPFETPLKNVYLANIEQVYPWDRGTNYAVELGEKISDMLIG